MLCSQLWDAGATGIEEIGGQLCAYFEASTTVESVRMALVNSSFSIQTNLSPVYVQEDPNREPILAGSRFVIVPANTPIDQLNEGGRIALPIDAAMASGSGRHETTQLCLQALELCLKPGSIVFDVGCGSGILSLAAQKMGAGEVIGADIDEASILIARRHFKGPLFVGSADGFFSNAADVVISNITGPVNDRIAYDLHRISKPDGLLILSGFTDATRPLHFSPDQVLRQGDWLCWICSRSGIRPGIALSRPNTHETQWWL